MFKTGLSPSRQSVALSTHCKSLIGEARMRLRPYLIALACSSVALNACHHEEVVVEHVRIVPQVSPIQPRRLQYSPVDGNRLLVVEATGQVGVWDVTTVKAPQLFASIDAGAIDAAFSADGQSIATVGVDGHVRWWSTDGRLKWISKGNHASPARAIAIGPNFLASGSEDGELRLWGTDGSPMGEPMHAHQASVVSLAISPHGDLASVGADDTVYLWVHDDHATAPGPSSAQPKVLYRPQNTPFSDHYIGLVRHDPSWGWDHSIAFSPHGDIVVAALLDDSVRLWSVDGTSGAVIPDAHPTRHVRAVSFSPTGDGFATAGFDGMIRHWNVDGSPQGDAIIGHSQPAFSVAFTPSGDQMATAGFDNAVRIWNTADGKRVAEFPRGHTDRVLTVALATHEPAVAVATDTGDARIWNLDGTPRSVPLVGHRGPVVVLAFSPKDDLVASGGHDGTVRLWALDGSPRSEALAVGPDLASIVFSPQGETWAAGTAPFQMWANDRRLWQQPMLPGDRMRCIGFTPRGDAIVTGSALGVLQVWNRNGSPRISPLKQKWEWIAALAVAPDGDYFAAADGAVSGQFFSLFNMDGSPRGEPLTGHWGAIQALAFTPTGQLVAGGDDGVVRLWTFPSRQVQTIDIGLGIDQLGLWRKALWVRANDDTIFFYDQSHTLVATTLLRRNAILTFTPDGWVSGTDQPTRFVRMFRDNGQALSEAEAGHHVSAERVLDALTKAGDAAASS
jgi:WD40 repeat protein